MAKTTSDLVLDSKLETTFLPDGDTVVHIRVRPGRDARRRVLRTEESWRRKWKLGGGSFGVVWLEECTAGEPTEGRFRAVKEIFKGADPSALEDYRYRELEAVAKFSHDKYAHCFVRSYGWFENERKIFIAMEYAKHGDLQSHLTQPFPEQECRQITAQVLEGVSFMHGHGFSHRDLKPGVGRTALFRRTSLTELARTY